LTIARSLQKEPNRETLGLLFADPVFQLSDTRAQKVKDHKTASKKGDFHDEAAKTMASMEGTGVRFDRLERTAGLDGSLKEIFNNRLDSYIGLEATKVNLIDKLGPRLKDYRNIIFATHGYFGTKLHNVLEPVLILTLVPEGTDGFLRISDVLNMNLNADMVALTACQSGMGKSVSGEGVMGLGRAFQYAGSKTVFMSLWNVSEKPSVMLVESLFRRLKEGHRKPVAMKMARDDVRKQGYDHPYFWAGFVLNGDQN
jgi:CHAT domain-containing protein